MSSYDSETNEAAQFARSNASLRRDRTCFVFGELMAVEGLAADGH